MQLREPDFTAPRRAPPPFPLFRYECTYRSAISYVFSSFFLSIFIGDIIDMRNRNNNNVSDVITTFSQSRVKKHALLRVITVIVETSELFFFSIIYNIHRYIAYMTVLIISVFRGQRGLFRIGHLIRQNYREIKYGLSFLLYRPKIAITSELEFHRFVQYAHDLHRLRAKCSFVSRQIRYFKDARARARVTDVRWVVLLSSSAVSFAHVRARACVRAWQRSTCVVCANNPWRIIVIRRRKITRQIYSRKKKRDLYEHFVTKNKAEQFFFYIL